MIPCAAHTDMKLQELLGEYGRRTKSTSDLPDDVPSSVTDLFSLHFKCIDKLFEKDGVNGLETMSETLGKIKVFSLFSGLGGAELAAQQLFHAVKSKCEQQGVKPPDMPENLLSCDVDPACQEILANHLHPSRYLMDDMLRFISPR